jgi:hypothetical protein
MDTSRDSLFLSKRDSLFVVVGVSVQEPNALSQQEAVNLEIVLLFFTRKKVQRDR